MIMESNYMSKILLAKTTSDKISTMQDITSLSFENTNEI